MSDCLFCKIRDGLIPAKVVYQDDACLAFEDINPQAPTHVLFIPRKHIATVNDVTAEDEATVGHLFVAAAKLAKQRGHDSNGYRVVMNTHRDAGQTVFHIHLHLLAGRPLLWPPG
ncbi:histidine triad nucleotide-binding protein [Myxococcus sp. CA051A]|uniref:histidine triad nucleotide-binding protein n=1 Tax=unclassified Myxococcus TaxID=2648731 RepID=UPI00157AFD0E|nr:MULTISPECIES: histidine triad nucleotide-binding protein [unclassified Myxococcus]NTX11610.1 histidine triad nucleotide-binding protein [Myxococcus sp. CA056]NTX34293.1 histidine triad nucleotide-binding protein [Myxococcus sp. CA033]NTX52709.1 histidine triad nucleotide-binding protein [Myxococcus sp. CA039A]NTX60878.1 histidine triad nucleotide-binding protein [Myxococcus sp. CA051A]